MANWNRSPARGGMTLTLEGFSELDAELGKLKKRTARNAMKRALTEAAEPMAQAMRRQVPRDDDQLHESISVSTRVKNEAGKAAYAGVMKAGGTRGAAVEALNTARQGGSFFELYVGPSIEAPHGHLQEFGTEHHAAQPFARPGFDEEAQATLDRLRVTLSDEINRAVARAARKRAR